MMIATSFVLAIFIWFEYPFLTLLRMGFFWTTYACGGGGAKSSPLPKICHTYPTMMKFYSYTLPWHTLWVLLTSAFFHRGSVNFGITKNADIDCILVHNFNNFSSLNKPGYNFFTINKILCHQSNHIVDVVMWLKFGNPSISIREVTITSILKWFVKKNHFFLRGGLGSSSIIWDWH